MVSLDIFPAGLLDKVSVIKSYSPDRSAEFAGGLVEIVPTRMPSRSVFDLSYQVGLNSQTVGEPIFDHPSGDRDWLGLECGSVRAAVWNMRMLAAANVLARREGTNLFVPVNPRVDPDGEIVSESVVLIHRLAASRGVVERPVPHGHVP